MDSLNDEQRAAVEESLRPTGTREGGTGVGPAAPAGADRFVYRLRLGAREALIQEPQLAEALRPLMDHLRFNQAEP